MTDDLEDRIAALFAAYREAVMASCLRDHDLPKDAPDEVLMRSVERELSVPQARKAEFRNELANYFKAKELMGEPVDCHVNERLYEALAALVRQPSGQSSS